MAWISSTTLSTSLSSIVKVNATLLFFEGDIGRGVAFSLTKRGVAFSLTKVAFSLTNTAEVLRLVLQTRK